MDSREVNKVANKVKKGAFITSGALALASPLPFFTLPMAVPPAIVGGIAWAVEKVTKPKS